MVKWGKQIENIDIFVFLVHPGVTYTDYFLTYLFKIIYYSTFI